MMNLSRLASVGCLLVLAMCGAPRDAAAEETLTLPVRTRVEVQPGSGRYHTLRKELQWDPARTAIVVCDMWDKHWCPTATERVAEMAPRMNEVLKAARARGVLIIHCPSDTMEFYKDTPQYRLAQSAPPVKTPVPLQNWCSLEKSREGNALPIDDSDGGCDCTDREYRKNFRAWTRQIDTLEIAPGDAITDNAQAYYLMRQRGIKNVIVMGVHTNMCVLGRPFSIRQMVRQGQQVVLMRDMTDSMYNPKMRPFVSHSTGTDLVVEHIEKFWCPTTTSAAFLGGAEFRFRADRRKHIVLISAEREYRTEESLPRFAMEQLGRDYRVSFVFADAADPNSLPGLEVIQDADVVLLSVRRRTLQPAQLKLIRDYLAAGRPLVGIRTASHAFCLRKGDPPDGLAQWPEFDAEILGGNYSNHHGNGPKTVVTAVAPQHPILRGVDTSKLRGNGSLYKVSPLARTATPLLLGSIPEKAPEPIAWVNQTKFGGRVFYTSLGHIEDFAEPEFQRLLKNAIDWAVAADPQPSVPGPAQTPDAAAGR